MAHEKLARSPLVEAVVDVRVQPGKQYSLIPGGIEQALSDDYPTTIETEAGKILGLMGQLPPTDGPALFPTHQFKSPDEKRMVQLAPNGIVINDLIYDDFDHFSTRARAVVTHYFKVAAVKSVKRIGVRYINKIRPGPAFLNGLRVNCGWPELANSRQLSLTSRASFQFSDPPGQLGVVVGAPDRTSQTILDLDFVLEPKRRMSVDEVMTWTSSAHERIYETFRSILTPELYAELGGKPS